MVHVYSNLERVHPDIVRRYSGLGAATVYEASGRKGSVDPGIKPLRAGVTVLGPAFTVLCRPKDNLMLHKALQLAREGDVLVVSTEGYWEAGYWGGLMATSAMARKLGGLVIDGCIRDSREIADMGFPVFCRGTCMRGTVKQNLGLVNHPLIFGEVAIYPGDLVVGDDDGLVIVPRQRAEEVLLASLKRLENEEAKTISLKSGTSSVELNKLEPVFQSLGLVEE
jgi:4-hydroxy-4-methyl-2-oxoglutarate aldolase